MTDKSVQDVELDDNNDVVDEAHDPKNAEKQSIAATSKATGVTKQAPSRKGDKRNSDPMPKSKAGMISAAHDLMSEMSTEQLAGLIELLTSEDEEEDAEIAESKKVHVSVDFTADLNALVESESTLSEEFKVKTAAIFEAAIKSKLSEEIDRLEEAYAAELQEEVATIRNDLVEKVNGYLNYVVESWMQENKLAIQNGLRTEIAETFMNKLKDLFVESYVEVPESKADLFEELATANEELEEQLNKSVSHGIKLAEELENYKRNAIILEASRGLADTQVEKLKSLAEGVAFNDEESFAEKIRIIRESYFNKKTTESVIEEDTPAVTEEISSSMSRYLSALRKTS